MRVLILTTAASWTPDVRLPITLGAELAARGDIVTVACLSHGALERSVEATFPRLPVRGITGQGAFARIRSARGIVAALRPDAVLVQSEPDALLAALATGRRGGVVRRWAVGEDAPDRHPAARTWRTRLAGSRTRLTSWGRDPIAVSWPGPSSPHLRGDTPAGETVPTALWIVPPAEHDERTAVALRAAARLVGRHPSLRIVLLGDLAALQSTRVHAASLGLTAFVQIAPLEALLLADDVEAAAVWITADGDEGAIATIAAMQRGIPVVVPSALSFASIVASRITGFVTSDADVPAIVAELARLMSDRHEYDAMGDAARARASRQHDWQRFVDDAAEVLSRASGSRVASAAIRASLSTA
ncbi:glycosyltransferase [Gemmatimonas groenlandica]|uniref:Glycosyltransferase n=1 Tax=Gemmatimonas groenlandica TaxID=2732249 RepID=A0A6M4ITI9_9BACT|nr:glycosyltransferase [Gemmatimonas groenlandica]QJR36132.1 glycosyltransferase [Gemmatimonas groenlandica]